MRDSTERETQTSEIQELAKGITKMIEGYQTFKTQQRRYRSLQKEYGNLSQELEKAEKLLEDHDKSKEVALNALEKSQRDLEESKRGLANKNEKKSQAKSKTVDDLHKQLKNATKNKSPQKMLSQEKRSKCDILQKEAHRSRLTSRKLPGRKWFL